MGANCNHPENGTANARYDEVYRTYHDMTGEHALSYTVVDAVATVVSGNASDLDPLYECIDPDALDSLFRRKHGGESRSGEGYLAFSQWGYRVVVHSDGLVCIYRPTGN